MALNRDKIGTTYPSFEHEVTREAIHTYAKALGETDPRYLSEGDDCVAPPTYAAKFTIIEAMMSAFGDNDLGTHPALVHGSQGYEFGRPVTPGDKLTCTTSIKDMTARGRNEFLVAEVECLHADGELAVRSTNTIVFLGSAPQEDNA